MSTPWEATVDGVAALLPDAGFPEILAPGQKGITRAQVAVWIDELAGQVDLRLAGWDRLTDPARRDALSSAVRAALHNGAASYVEAARHPDRAGKGESSYSDVLMARYEKAIGDLETLLAVWLEDGDESTPEVGTSSRPAWSFPASFVPDYLRW